MGLVDVWRNAVQDLTPSHSGWECCLPNPHLTVWGTLKHINTHTCRHIGIYMCILFTWVFVCIGMWRETLKHLSFLIFPFFFFHSFCKIQSRCWERWLKKDVPKEQMTAAVSACTFLGGCHQDLKDQRGEKWPWSSSSVLGTGTVGTGRPWAPCSGKEAHPSYPPKDLWTWRGTIWHLTGHQGHSTPFANIMLSH